MTRQAAAAVIQTPYFLTRNNILLLRRRVRGHYEFYGISLGV